MTYQNWLHLFALIVVVCSAIIGVIDLGAEFNIKIALRLKWSLFWNTLRYIAMGCALALAVDVLF